MLCFTNVRVAAGGEPTTVHLRDGLIAAIGNPAKSGPASDATIIDTEGMLMLPGLVEPHLHLDKALLDHKLANSTGTLVDAITTTAILKRSFTRVDLLERGQAVMEALVAHGTTTIRVHPDIDPGIGLAAVDAMFELKSRYAGIVDIQIVAFPQEGILSRPGTLDLLREALAQGADAIGGCSYSEPTIELCRTHVETVLDLAAEYDVPADIHADFSDDTSDERFMMAGYIAKQAALRGLHARVTLSHMTALASVDPSTRAAIIAELVAADVRVVALPSTDLHLSGRSDTHRIRRGITPLAELRSAGVLTAISSNNIRNAFTPFGNADQFETGLLLAQAAHMSTTSALDDIVSMVTTDAAAVIGLQNRTVAVGSVADLIIVDGPSGAEALLDRAPRRYVVKAGRVVAENFTRTVRHYTPGTTAIRPRLAFTSSPSEAS